MMGLKKFRADRIFDGERFLEGNPVLITDEQGVVISLVPETEAGDELQVVKGTLTPGFINAHCHLELSHMKGVIPPHTGLVPFLLAVVQKRGFDPGEVQNAIEKAEGEMYQQGIVAVGDIGNTADTLPVKLRSRIAWNNFVEVLSFTDEQTNASLKHYSGILDQFRESAKALEDPTRLVSSLVPHAPYTISPQSFNQINQLSASRIISMHNQETEAEDILYKTGKGAFLTLLNHFGITASPFPVTGKSSLQSVLPWLDLPGKMLLVHNTFTTETDIDFAATHADTHGVEIFYCLCPNANLYIENRMPPVDLFIRKQCQIVLGTDSYSSNWQLSIAEEIRTLLKHIPDLSLETALGWATFQGARALGREHRYGRFRPGMQPGILVLNEELRPTRLL